MFISKARWNPRQSSPLQKNMATLWTKATVAARYATRDFTAFIEAYKWVTSYLRMPADYALELAASSSACCTKTSSTPKSPFRRRDAPAQARRRGQLPRHSRSHAAPFESRGLRLQWIFDVVRQFGATAAWDVARLPAVPPRTGCGRLRHGGR